MKKISAILKNRKYIIIILSGLLFLQIILFIYFNIFSFQSVKSRTIEKKLLKGFNKDTVIAIQISDIKNSLEIKKENGSWFVDDNNLLIPADPEKLNYYLDILEGLNQGIIRDNGEDPETVKKYGFTEDIAKRLIIITSGNMTFTLIIGTAEQTKGITYIKFNDDKAIREIKSEIGTATDSAPKKWAR